MTNKQSLRDKEIREEFYTDFSIAVHRREDGTLQEFGLSEHMADLDTIADFFLDKREAELKEILEELEEYVKQENTWDEKSSDRFCKGALSSRNKSLDTVKELIIKRLKE